ncbi:MAG: Rrf2 family transcriptional regulator [Candidatus Eisenbacteria sp.]|nr:Rrf2 family transcriptional regulator [Candidatus Eisenbacteria bacterium]
MSGLVRASEAATLALHAAAIMASRTGPPVTAAVMADGLSASEAHLAKVLQRLAKAGLVTGTRGPGGGFRLTRPAKKISLRQVYEAIEGRLRVERCMVGKPLCNKLHCPLGSLFARLSDDVLETLGKTTLADIELPLKD